MAEPLSVVVTVNGVARELRVDPERSLLAALREDLDLTGAKYGCGEGNCGACSVLVDEEVAQACVTRAADVHGRSVTTAEGLAEDGALHGVQESFMVAGAMQCGYCTPGMVVAAAALLRRDPDPDERTIRSWMQPNICRCCTYLRIVDAIRSVPKAWSRPGPAHQRRLAPEPRRAEQAHPRAPWDLVSLHERDHFEVLGDGLVVVVEPEEPAPGTWPATGGAWLHVGPGGTVTAFTGKVEVGQGTRGALRLAVARELGVHVDRIRLVMGDTDVCPYDVGTFGSRSMPTALPDLRIAAATARRELDGASSAGSGALAGVRRVVVADRDTDMVPPERWRDTAPDVEDRVELVTGEKRFASDLALPGLWHGRVLRPATPGASLLRVDVSAALAMADVVVVHEGDFVGVAAPDATTAQRALDTIDAEWEERDLVGEDQLERHLRAHPVESEGWEGTFEHRDGDVDTALAHSAIDLRATYTTAYLAHAPLETRVALAQWQDERLTVWTATQRPFPARATIAEAFGIDEARVRVVVPDAGGGFGGKHEPDVAIEAARLARACGHPVKVRWSRDEEFTHAYFRPAAVIDVQIGATSDGDLTAWRFVNTNSGSAAIMPPYRAAVRHIRFQPADSPLREGAYRALAATANNFARESAIDELAVALRSDPVELRVRLVEDERLAAVLMAAAERFGWSKRAKETGVGSGIAAGVEKGGRVTTCVEVRATSPHLADLEVVRVLTAFECGAIVDEDNLRNQVEGAMVMGLGGALFEAVHFDQRHISNSRFSEYRVPRFLDVPPIDVVLLDRPDLPPSGGGETPIVAIAPALANAIYAATGLRHRSLPLLHAGGSTTRA